MTPYRDEKTGRFAKRPEVSGETKNAVIELTGKFSKNFVDVASGKTATKEKGVSFTGKAKASKGKAKEVKDSNKTASKIKPLKQGNELIDMLLKIYNFMDKNYKDDQLRREQENNFKEEAATEAGKRHDKLLKAIEDLKNELKLDKKDTAEVAPTADSGGSFLDTIASVFNIGKAGLTALGWLGELVASPLGVGLIGAVVAGTVGAWMVKQIAADPQAALRGEGGIGMAVAGLGSEGQGPSYDEEQTSKELTKKAEQVDKKGLKKATLEELEAKLQQQTEFGHTKTPKFAELTKEIALRKSEQAPDPAAAPSASPAAAPAAAPSASPAAAPAAAPSAPASAKLNSVQAENNTAKIDEMSAPPEVNVNNSSTTSSTQKPTPQPKKKLPPVRNLEETFQKMIVYSTRVV